MLQKHEILIKSTQMNPWSALENEQTTGKIVNLYLVISRLPKMPQILIWIWLTFDGVQV